MGYNNIGDIKDELENFGKEATKILKDGRMKVISEHWDSLKWEFFLIDSVFIRDRVADINVIVSFFVIFSLFSSMIVTMESEKDKFELQKRLSMCTKEIKYTIAELLENLAGSEFRSPEYRDWTHRVVDCLKEIDDDCKKHELYE